MFDKEKFGRLLTKAKGNVSLNAYAENCGVSSAYISKLIRGLNDTPPSPNIIKKLESHDNGVSYGSLMAAAGHISSLEEDEKLKGKRAYLLKDDPVYRSLHPDLDKRFNNLSEEDKFELDRFMQSASLEEVFKYSESLSTVSDLQVLIKGEEEAKALVTSLGTVNVPILGEITCNDPVLSVKNFTEYRKESPDNLPEENVFYVKVNDNSMEPTIPNGCLVLIKEQAVEDPGKIMAVLLNDGKEVVLKRFREQGDLKMLVSDNPNSEVLIITKENPVKVLGQAIICIQEL